MELKIKSIDRLAELLSLLSLEGYKYSVETVYDTSTYHIRVAIKYYLVTIEDNICTDV